MRRFGGEIAVVGVKTRARAALTMATKSSSSSSPSKKIKKASKTSSYHTNSNISCSYQLRSGNRRRNLPVSENFATQRDSTAAATAAVAVVEEEVANCSSSEVITRTITTTNNSDLPPSCSSSNENNDQLSSSNDVVLDRCVADPEVEKKGEASLRSIDCNTATTEEKEESSLREEATKSNGQDCTTKLPDGKSTVQIKTMPSDLEIEEFFKAAENDLHKRFIDKYNFDFVKEMPLEGRYEWVPIKP